MIWIWTSRLTGEHRSQRSWCFLFHRVLVFCSLADILIIREKSAFHVSGAWTSCPALTHTKSISRPSIPWQGLSIITIFIAWPALQALLQSHAMISQCTDVKETCQCLEVKSPNIITCHPESNGIKTGIQVWGNKKSRTPHRLGQGSLVRRLTSPLWPVSVKEGGTTFALSVTPIESPGCHPRVWVSETPNEGFIAFFWTDSCQRSTAETKTLPVVLEVTIVNFGGKKKSWYVG